LAEHAVAVQGLVSQVRQNIEKQSGGSSQDTCKFDERLRSLEEKTSAGELISLKQFVADMSRGLSVAAQGLQSCSVENRRLATQIQEVEERAEDTRTLMVQQLALFEERLPFAASSTSPRSPDVAERRMPASLSPVQDRALQSRVEAVEQKNRELMHILEENSKSWETFAALTTCLQTKDGVLEARLDALEKSMAAQPAALAVESPLSRAISPTKERREVMSFNIATMKSMCDEVLGSAGPTTPRSVEDGGCCIPEGRLTGEHALKVAYDLSQRVDALDDKCKRALEGSSTPPEMASEHGSRSRSSFSGWHAGVSDR